MGTCRTVTHNTTYRDRNTCTTYQNIQLNIFTTCVSLFALLLWWNILLKCANRHFLGYTHKKKIRNKQTKQTFGSNVKIREVAIALIDSEGLVRVVVKNTEFRTIRKSKKKIYYSVSAAACVQCHWLALFDYRSWGSEYIF